MPTRRSSILSAARHPFMGGLIALTLLCITGCDREEGRARPAKVLATEYADVPTAGPGGADPTASGAVLGAGVIKGKIKYTGPKPPLSPQQRECHPGKGNIVIPDESVVVSDAGDLRFAVAFIKNPPGEGPNTPAPAMDNVNCIYDPHVVAVRAGQSVRFTSSDPILHNVHVMGNPNGEYNQGISKGDVKPYPVKAPAFARVKCDVHPWMSGYIAVFEHGYYAVSKPDGSFEIKGLPAGAYTLSVWHEKLGTMDQEVTVAEDKPLEVTLTYKK